VELPEEKKGEQEGPDGSSDSDLDDKNGWDAPPVIPEDTPRRRPKKGSKKSKKGKKRGSSKKKRSKRKQAASTKEELDAFEFKNIKRKSEAQKTREQVEEHQRKLLSTIGKYEKDAKAGWVHAPAPLNKNTIRLRLRAATICPQLEWLRLPGPEGAILHFCTAVPTVDPKFYSNTYIIDWKYQRTMELVRRGDIRDPALLPPPVNGVPFVEKAKDKKKRLAREAREAEERRMSYGKKAKWVCKKLPLTNRGKTMLEFKMYCEPPGRFQLSTYSSTATSSISSQTKDVPTESTMLVAPGENMETEVCLVPPAPSNTAQWPAVRSHKIEGNVVIEYTNGFQQRIPLSATLLRPLTVVSPRFYDFQYLLPDSAITLGVAQNPKQQIFTISNPSDSPAAWSVVHLPRKLKFKDVSAMDPKVLDTLTNPEFEERYDWADEPDVFSFDQEVGEIPPQGEVKVTVTFQPKIAEDYFSLFRFVTAFTALDEESNDEEVATIQLLGTGKFDEALDHDYDFHY
jgi:hypothetical protein